MRTTTFLLSCAPALATATLFQYPSEFDFAALIQRHERLFVSFTSPALESIAPLNDIFTQSATNLSTPFITIDCRIGISLCKSYDVNSFPTFRLLERSQEDKKMKETRFQGPRTIQALQSFVKKRELPVLSHFNRSDMDFRRIDPIIFVAFLDPSDTTSLTTYDAIAQKHHVNFAFGYSIDTSIAQKENVQVPSIVCYRNNDNDNLILGGAFTFDDVENFLVAAQKSVIKDFREKDMGMFMLRDRLTIYIFTHTPSPIAIRHELTLLAKTLYKFVTFAIVNLSRYPEMPANFGVEMKGEQALVVHAPMNDQIFRYAQGKKIESAVVEEMLMIILQGKASEGQVFGEGAEDLDDGEEFGRHDEL